MPVVRCVEFDDMLRWASIGEDCPYCSRGVEGWGGADGLFYHTVPDHETDAAPPVAKDTKFVFLAGAIKHWWEQGMWDSTEHRDYLRWRNEVRAVLIEEGYLTYAPHEAFKGTWTERAQAVNDAGIAACDVMLVLSPEHIPTEGTDLEVDFAQRRGVRVVYAPPTMTTSEMLVAVQAALADTHLQRA